VGRLWDIGGVENACILCLRPLQAAGDSERRRFLQVRLVTRWHESTPPPQTSRWRRNCNASAAPVVTCHASIPKP
jgi:hypothetical protein